MSTIYLNPYQVDVLREMVNIGVGRAAAAMNEMLNSHVSLKVPQVSVIRPDELRSGLREFCDEKLASVRLAFRGPLVGSASIVFAPESADRLVNALHELQPGTPVDAATRTGTLSEVGNIVLNSLMGSISNLLKLHLNYSVPNYTESSVTALLSVSLIGDHQLVYTRTRFDVEDLHVHGVVFVVFDRASFAALAEGIKRLDKLDEM